MSYRLVAPLLLAAACTDPTGPSPQPPGPWGVPITGGTILVTRDGDHAVIADPDRDRIVSVALGADLVVAELDLPPGDEPGRVIEDGAGRIHVALRHGGALLTLDGPETGQIVARRAVCGEPRGLAWDPTGDVVHVACAGGELVTLPAAGGAATRTLRLDRDLRDVVISDGQLMVTRFRTAEILTLDAAGAIVSRFAPPPLQRFGVRGPEVPVSPSLPAVAWRAIGLPDGRVLVSHQRQLQGVLGTSDDGYGGSNCTGRVEATLTTARPGELPFAVRPAAIGTLPVDIAVSKSGDRVALVFASSQRVLVMPALQLDQPDTGENCTFPPTTEGAFPGQIVDQLGSPTSVEYTPEGELVIFYPELPGLIVRSDSGETRTIMLPGGIGYNSGRALFHRESHSRLACATCHPEGRDDGLIWEFVGLGRRRTQSLAGGILSRAPYHWSGDLPSLPALMQEVFTGRMSGGDLTESEKRSLGPWLDRLPAPTPSPGDAEAIARGRALFESTEVGCAGCHAGALLTNNGRFAVGTGAASEPFKVPSLLGLADRAPFMHDGCARTLHDRFGPCGGGDLHGKTSQLSAAQIDDLVAYLTSL